MSSRKPGEGMNIPWHEWGEETFSYAQENDIPVFLYLFVDWGHDQHRFELNVLASLEIRDLVRNQYVPVRVNSLIRPDLFERYNQGGWPSICCLSPTGELLHGLSRPTFDQTRSMLEQVAPYYKEHRDEIRQKIEQAGAPGEILFDEVERPNRPDESPLQWVKLDALALYDRKFKGFGRFPKSPKPDTLQFLLESGDDTLAVPAYETLNTISQSQLYDHLGGGFFRYCDDEAWRFPHTEKLLSDNVALMEVLLDAYRRRKDERYEQTANGILQFLENNLGDEETGLFFAALDSASEPGDRSSYYGWSLSEIVEVLDEPTSNVVAAHLGIEPGAALPDGSGRCFPEIRASAEQVALQFRQQVAETVEHLAKGMTSLMQYRSQRPKPQIVHVFLTAANARLMGLLAEHAMVEHKPRSLQRAFEIADLIWENAHIEDGGVRHEIDGSASPLFFADQVETVLGYIRLYRAAGRGKDLVRAEQTAHDILQRFVGDNVPAGFDTIAGETAIGAEAIRFMPFDTNSRWMLAMTELHIMTEDETWREHALHLAEAMKSRVPRYRLINSTYGRALARLLSPPPVVDLITGDGTGEMRLELVRNAPSEVQIRAFDPDQVTPWTPVERYPSNGGSGRAALIVEGKRKLLTSDIEEVLETFANSTASS
ncbi:DUF255 domain-containing protein [bacterium]|nr:DUF255 domain-containing protein [bacterium]